MLVRRIAREDWWKIGALTAILLTNMIATVFAYPTFQANYGMLMNLVPSFMGFVKNALNEAGKGGLPVFMAVNHFFKGANVIGPAAAIVLALGTVVREVEIGSIGLLLSRPVSRRRILWTFAACHLVELMVPLFLVSALIPFVSSHAIDKEVALAPLLVATVHAAAFIAAIYSIALLAAVVFAEQIRVAAFAGGVCIVSFMLYFIDATRPYTLYALSSIEGYMSMARGEPMPLAKFAACIAIAITAIGAATALFERKDY